MQTDFSGKTALVTGAGAGLGSAFVEALAERGAAVALLDIDAESVSALSDALNAKGFATLAVHADVACAADLEKAVAATVAAFGGIDILINNAGLHSAKYNVGFDALGLAETRRLFDVNLLGLVALSAACRPVMAERGGGVIVNMASSAAFTSNSAYGVSKLAVRGATICLATEYAIDGIRVNAIAPGLVGTDANIAQLPPALFARYENELQLIRRPGRVSDIVDTMLYLCSEQSSFITGEVISVTGGYPLAI
jgi:3-oxoacyl-[acyl-carrier protein] reductase